MKDFLSNFDMFQFTASLAILGKSAYSSVYSSIASFCLLILYIALLIYLGIELFVKTKPFVVVENIIPLEHSKTPVNNNNFTILFRLENEEMQPVNIPEITPKLFYYEYEKTESGLKLVVKKWSDPVPCTDIKIDPNPALSGLKLSEWLCIDWDNIRKKINDVNPTLGGTFEVDFFNYISITLNSCKNQTTNEGCSSTADIEARLNKKNHFIAVYHPIHHFDKDDTEEPLKVLYTRTINMISPNIAKQDRLTFGKVLISDDQNWILNLPVEKEALGLLKMESVTDFRNSVDFSKNVTIYNMWITFTKDQVLYTRSYVKFQEIVAEIGGIISMFSLFFSPFFQKLNENLMKLEIAENFIFFKNRSYDTVRSSNSKYKINMGFYRKIALFMGLPFIKKDKEFERCCKFIDEKFDMIELFKMRANLDFLNRILLTETDTKFLKENLKIILEDEENTSSNTIVGSIIESVKEGRFDKKQKEMIQIMNESQVLKLNQELDKEGLTIN